MLSSDEDRKQPHPETHGQKDIFKKTLTECTVIALLEKKSALCTKVLTGISLHLTVHSSFRMV